MCRPKPVLLCILDGLAMRQERYGNAVLQARKPNFDRYWALYPHTVLEASGRAVGLPEGQMGNSEVGHLNMGAGRVIDQDFTRITRSIQEGDFFCNDLLLKMCSYAKKKGKKLHLCGLLSDGGVHSHIDHLYALLALAAREGVEKVYVHAFLDGRDVPPRSATSYVTSLQHQMSRLGIGEIASIHGRYYAMDRDLRWDRTQATYRAMVNCLGERCVDALTGIQESYRQGVTDEFILPRVVDGSDGCIQEGDAVFFHNFRPDRAIQLSAALTQKEFSAFDRGSSYPKTLFFSSLTHYSESIVGSVAYESITPRMTLGETLSQHGLRQLRIAETEKYPHVTFFFNGGREQAFPGEDRLLISSPQVATYDLKPEMSAYEVTEKLLEKIGLGEYDTIILNFANPDMVGHSGKLAPTIQAIEAVDKCLGRIVDLVHQQGGVAIITADHGNADQVLDREGNPYTAHTTFPVPCIVTDPRLLLRSGGVLADLAPTLLQILHIQPPPEMGGRSLIIS